MKGALGSLIGFLTLMANGDSHLVANRMVNWTHEDFTNADKLLDNFDDSEPKLFVKTVENETAEVDAWTEFGVATY